MAFMALTFTSCEDVPEPYGQPVSPKKAVVDPEGSGTASDPYNVAAAIAKCKEIGDAVSSEKFYVKGYAATEGKADASYGNASFYMTDAKDGSGKRFYAYQVLGSDGQKMTEGYTIKVGDEVIVYGPMYNYSNKTPETASKGAAYIVTVNGQKTENTGGDTPTGEAKGTGTQSDPFNVAAAIAKCKEIGTTESTEKYYIKGKVVADATPAANYGNVTFKMVDEEGGAQFTAYQVLGSDGNKMPTTYTIPKGAEVVVYGPIYNYSGNTPETAGKGAAYIVTVNGQKTAVEGGGDTPSGNYGTKDAPLTVAKAIEIINGLADNGTASPAYVKGKISKVQSFNDKYKSITYYISDDGTDNNALQVYSGKGIDGADFAAQTDLEAGWTVVVTGELKKYVNNSGAVTLEINQSSQIVSIDKNGSGGGGSSTGASSYTMDFKTNELGSWTISDKTKPSEIEAIWKYNNKYGMVATAFANSTNFASESWIISPKFDLSGASKATLTLHHAINFFTSVDVAKAEVLVKVSTDGTNWTNLTLAGWPEKLSWTFFDSTADFSAYAGKKDIQIAFVYTSTAEKAGTWEIEKVTIE